MAEKHVVVAAHGHCFDGLVSAAMFTHLRRQLDPRPVRFSYRSCGYGPTMQEVPARWLRGDENAIVDFRYADNERLTWFFDHHVTAFSSDEQRASALARSKRYFFEPTYGSCTKLIADVGRSRFGVDFERYQRLIDWADKIDSASFGSAAEAIDRSTAEMRLAAVIEQRGDGALLGNLAPRLLDHDAAELMAEDDLARLWQAIDQAQHHTRDRIAERLQRDGRVAYVELGDQALEASGKFVAYALAPDCVYSVALIRMKKHLKISVGFNPWSPDPRQHDIAEICRRHGGGGHAVVGAFSVSLDRPEEAQRLAREVVGELNQ